MSNLTETNQVKAERLVKILDTIDKHHNIAFKPIVYAFLTMKILCAFDMNIDEIKSRLDELNEVAGHQDISGTMKGYELMGLTHLYQNRIENKW